ncbi:class I SAM-dependent methyltransferase [Nocardioides sp.]|uniref:class I SAM-dependent methyltransferase n=1 Tax=Nocardioides sp. TaxID=35761 RepID=UPI0031FEAA83|nr:class SAM-dependent methyltransferase [Nocardioides sp.]
MGLWADRVVPRLTDKALGNDEIGQFRAVACSGLHGRVLEIGFGSGLNLPHYPPEVTSVSAVEPADLGWALSEKRRGRSSVPVERAGLDGQRLDAPDASYDGVLSTFTLCTIPDAVAALAEVRRVLRPGGAFHFLEHGRAPDDNVVAWQRRLEPVQRRVFAGCHLTRDVPALVGAAGLDVTMLEQSYLPGPRIGRPWSYGYLGRAVRPV